MSLPDPPPEQADDDVTTLATAAAATWGALPPEARNPDPAQPPAPDAATAVGLEVQL